jgi:hypothetical protein
VKLTCSVLGTPDPIVEWKHNDKILKPHSLPRFLLACNDGLATLEVNLSFKIYVRNTNIFSSLQIRDTQLEDGGEYTCTAKNEMGEATSNATLKIYRGYEPEPYVPTFTSSIKGMSNNLLNGITAMKFCLVSVIFSCSAFLLSFLYNNLIINIFNL